MEEEGTTEGRPVSFDLYFWFPQKQCDSKSRSWKVLERSLCGNCVQMLLGHLGSGAVPLSSVFSCGSLSWDRYCPYLRDRDKSSLPPCFPCLLCTHQTCLLTTRNGDTVSATHPSYL